MGSASLSFPARDNGSAPDGAQYHNHTFPRGPRARVRLPMSALAFPTSAMRLGAASVSGRDLGARHRLGSSDRVASVSANRLATSNVARFARHRKRRATATPSAEQYAVSTFDAQVMFTERFPPGSVSVALQETPCGRGLVALVPIKEGDLLMQIPWKHTIHVFEDGYDDPDDLRLALELLKVIRAAESVDAGKESEQDAGKARDENEQNEQDKYPTEKLLVWARYRAMLPSSTGAAAFWRRDMIKELQHADAVEETTRLAMAFNGYATRNADDKNSKDQILWALSLVHSRSFSVVTPNGTARALVPFADLFNHNPESPAQARKTDGILQNALRVKHADTMKKEKVGQKTKVDFDDLDNDEDRATNERCEEICMSVSNGSEPWCVAWGTGEEGAGGTGGTEESGKEGSGKEGSGKQATSWFQMRSIWAYEPGDEVFITYGHETSAELLASYGFFPTPNAGDFVRIYTDVQDVLDDDRYVTAGDVHGAMTREGVMWSALAVAAPLAVRPGGIAHAAHLLGCLRVMHSSEAALTKLRDCDVPHIGHSTFVWVGEDPCGLWGPAKCEQVVSRKTACETGGESSVAVAERRAKENPADPERNAVDTAALGQAAARCVELLAEFPTSLEEDLVLLAELAQERERKDDEDEEKDENDSQYAVAVSYRVSVKRMLVDFVTECAAVGIPPSEW